MARHVACDNADISIDKVYKWKPWYLVTVARHWARESEYRCFPSLRLARGWANKEAGRIDMEDIVQAKREIPRLAGTKR